MMNENMKKNLRDFICGEKDFDEFSQSVDFDALLDEIQDEINHLNKDELNDFFDKFSHPVFEELNFFMEELVNEIFDKVKLLEKYQVVVPDEIYKNTTLEKVITDARSEIVRNHMNIKDYFKENIINNSFKQVYGRDVSFITQDLVFDFFAKIYDSLFDRIQNKNFEYKIRKSLIIDTDLDEILVGSDLELEKFVNDKIFIPTKHLTEGLNPSLEQYGKRLDEVRKLVKEQLSDKI